MYIPTAFDNPNKEEAIKLIERNSFGDLVTINNGELCSNKVPFIFDRDSNTLCGHFGNNNPQLIDIRESQKALAVFSGPHSYISPQWYSSENMVPTWNFQTVQVRGAAQIVSEERLFEILEKLTALHESQFEKQWSMSEVRLDRFELMSKMITGFEIEVSDIKFKEKMSQNRSIEDQQSVIKALNSQNGISQQDVAKIMNQNITL